MISISHKFYSSGLEYSKMFKLTFLFLFIVVGRSLATPQDNTGATELSSEPESEEYLYTKIGKRHFHIEKKKFVRWYKAKAECERIGGIPAYIEDEEDVQAILPKLNPNYTYWLDMKTSTYTFAAISVKKGKHEFVFPYFRHLFICEM